MERMQFWKSKDLGLDLDPGINVALSPLQSYLTSLNISFLFCNPPQRIEGGVEEALHYLVS